MSFIEKIKGLKYTILNGINPNLDKVSEDNTLGISLDPLIDDSFYNDENISLRLTTNFEKILFMSKEIESHTYSHFNSESWYNLPEPTGVKKSKQSIIIKVEDKEDLPSESENTQVTKYLVSEYKILNDKSEVITIEEVLDIPSIKDNMKYFDEFILNRVSSRVSPEIEFYEVTYRQLGMRTYRTILLYKINGEVKQLIYNLNEYFINNTGTVKKGDTFLEILEANRTVKGRYYIRKHVEILEEVYYTNSTEED